MNVLLVEDEESYRRNLERVLEAAGHVVHSASSGHAALQVAGDFDTEALVVDWMLRNSLDGLELARALQAERPGLTTILITGYPSRELRAKASEVGVFAFLEKPFRTGDLLAALERAGERSSGPTGP